MFPIKLVELLLHRPAVIGVPFGFHQEDLAGFHVSASEVGHVPNPGLTEIDVVLDLEDLDLAGLGPELEDLADSRLQSAPMAMPQRAERTFVAILLRVLLGLLEVVFGDHFSPRADFSFRAARCGFPQKWQRVA